MSRAGSGLAKESGVAVSQLFDVHGRQALVSGSTRGIGLALALGLARAGCAVVVHGRDRAALDRARTHILAEAGPGARVSVVAFDVTDPSAVAAGVAELSDGLDILVNNAGIQHREPVLTVAPGVWDRVVATNLTGAFLLARAVAPAMVARGAGKIVNICSLMSEVGRPGIAPYTAAKGGLKLLTRALCAELGPHNIQVNGIGPGYIATDLTADLRADAGFDAWVRQRAPAGRWGTTDDLLGALLFLVSAASDYVNGQIVYVDGGMLATI
jgi:gluconate 5-dehydrogenase